MLSVAITWVFMLICCEYVFAAKKNMAFYDKIWKTTMDECKVSDECRVLHPDENMNCLNKCTSDKCYEKVYASMPLEDGEIDPERERVFRSCLRDEAKRKKGSRF
jgi:hypothetical protein